MQRRLRTSLPGRQPCGTGGEAQPAPGATHLGVWAYSLLASRIGRDLGDVFAPEDRIVVVTAPASGNPNLYAQQGVLQFVSASAVRPECAGRPTAVGLHRGGANQRRDADSFYAAHPPGAGTILRLLAKDGVSGVALFPGYAGVVAGMQEEQFWRTKSESRA